MTGLIEPAVSDGIADFADAVAALDTGAGRAVIAGLMESGADPISVIDEVITPSQREVGLRWQGGQWSVAQQHAATEVALAGADEIARRLAPPRRPVGLVVLACAEREWHSLTVRLLGLAMRSAGWQTAVLGAGVSTVRLSRALHELGPDATAISCSVLAGLPTSRRFIEVSAAAGVPTVVGGAAFGPDAARADALGANAWAASARGAVHALAGLPLIAPVVPALARDLQTELIAVQAQQRSLHTELAAHWRPLGELGPAGPDTPAEVVGDCVDQALAAVLAALLTGDGNVLAETRTWVTDVLRARGDSSAAEHADQLGQRLGRYLREYPGSYQALQRGWN